MILIISHSGDDHADAVANRLSDAGAPFKLFDTAKYPTEIAISIAHHADNSTQCLLLEDGVSYQLNDVGAVWWRRPQPIAIHDGIQDEQDRQFTYGECHAALSGLWSCLDAAWINPPEKDEVGSRKAYQLKIAKQIGLQIPLTMISNCPIESRKFIDSQWEKGVIYKVFSATEHVWRETRLLREEELQELASVSYAPVIFQEHIVADIDLRVTVIGKEIFATEFLSGNTDYKVDFRMRMSEAPVNRHELPSDIIEKIHLFMRQLGLVYGAIDFRLTPAGQYFFLEINTAGQWLFCEERTGFPITQTVAEKLIKLDNKTKIKLADKTK